MEQKLIDTYFHGVDETEKHGRKAEKPLGSNCVSVTLMSFKRGDEVMRVIVKKSRIGIDKLDAITQEYQTLRHYLGDMIPSQAFIPEKCTEGGARDLITAICSPVVIAYDIFEGDNFEFLKKELENNHDLQNDIDLFISAFLALEKKGFIIDLYGDENLIVTNNGRLKYIDSFIVDMAGKKSLITIIQSRFEKLRKLGTLPSSGN